MHKFKITNFAGKDRIIESDRMEVKKGLNMICFYDNMGHLEEIISCYDIKSIKLIYPTEIKKITWDNK